MFRFMLRPRWHDVAIVAAIAGVLAVGVWALWWDDVRAALGLQPRDSAGSGEVKRPVPVPGDRT